jgi:small subunit ribosomal protein S16
MALVIRLRQQGRANRQTFRVVVADEKSPRDGKYIEMLGWYNPFQEKDNIKIDGERLNYWIEKGARVSENVELLASKVAPQVITDLHARKHAKKVKLAAKRRALKKGEKKAAAPKKAAPKKVATAKKK